jgi:signal transduction histidine kinase
MIVLGTALAGWLGWLFAGRTVAPVSRLAEAVDALPTLPRNTALAASVSHDELGRLASAIDRYQARLVEADAYEQTFFADASHELRTPVAVVRGTAEVLLDGPEADPGMRQRLRRLDRGMQELTDLLDVLLDLARRREMQMETMDARTLLAEAASASTGAGTAVRVEIEAAGRLLLPRRESLLLLRSVIRRLLPPDVPGLLQLRLQGSTVEFGFAPDDGSPSSRDTQSPQRSDRGFGLTLTARLAERMGWRWQQADDGLLRVSLPDSALI